MMSNIFFIFTDKNDSDIAYCLRCLRLSKQPCSCTQCEQCDLFYVDFNAHNCNRIPIICTECNIPITSASTKCYLCQCLDIFKICESLTPTNQYNLPQCLRCLKNIENNIPCSCIQCSDCSLYAKNVVCADCPLTFNESNSVYCKCEKNVVGGIVKGETKNLIEQSNHRN